MNIPNKNFWRFIFTIGIIYLVYVFFISPPRLFPEGETVVIKSGSLSKIAKQLKEERIIRSETFLKSITVFLGGEKHISPGDYKFQEKIPVWRVAKRIVNGEYQVAQIKITIPEGYTDREIALLVSSKFPNISKEDFEKTLLLKNTGVYPLFPDTYFFFPSASVSDIIEVMNSNYVNKVRPLTKELGSADISELNVIIMASIIEKESKNSSEKPIIAGILWKRIEKGMPLQVDAAPDTYKKKGLPTSPICEPGIDSITAALRPVESPYFYYLHDKMGIIHYAKTFAEHDANRARYLLK